MSQQPPRPPSPQFPPNGPAGPPNRPPMGPPPNRPAQAPQQPPYRQPAGPRPQPPQQPYQRPPQPPYQPPQHPQARPPYPPPQQQPVRQPVQQPVQQPPRPPMQAPPQRPPLQPPVQPPAQPPAEPPEAERPRRKPAAKTSLLGRIVGAVVVLALGAATVVLADLEVMPSDRMPPFVTEGRVGEVVTTSTFKIRVDKSFVARKLTFKELSFSDPEVRTTNAVWLLVPAAVQPLKQPEDFETATVVAKSGKRYFATNRVPDSAFPGSTGTAPGIAFLGKWVFEIPPEEIPGAELRVSIGVGDPQLEPEARIDLGIGADVVEKAMPTYDLSKDLL